jgi:kynurenine formamidase
MKLLDLSQPIWNGSPNCPSHAPVTVDVVADHAEQTDEPTWHMEVLSMASHTGSHLDAPLHKMPGGAAIDGLPLESFVGPAFIADLRGLQAEEEITPAHLEASLAQVLEALGQFDSAAGDGLGRQAR